MKNNSLGSFVPNVGPDDSWMLQLDPANRAKQHAYTLLQALSGPPRPDFNTEMTMLGRQSDNVQGPVEPDEPASVGARHMVADFNTDRMTQYDPYAEQRRQQAIQIANALSGQGANPQAPGIQDMRKRAGMESLLQNMQSWSGKGDQDLIPYDYKQRMFGRFK